MQLTYINLKKLLKTPMLGRGSEGSVYIKDDKVLKFANQFLYGSLTSPKNIRYINLDIIDYYNRIQSKIKFTNLPTDIINYKHLSVGVVYPYYREYKELSELYTESKDIFLEVLFKVVRNNMELLDNRIFNSDIQLSNILYKGKDVQLIDLDSKYCTTDAGNADNLYYLLMSIRDQVTKRLHESGIDSNIYTILKEIELDYPSLVDLSKFEKTLTKMDKIIK